MSVDLSGLPERVRLRPGERVLLDLPSYAGSGNYWSAEPLAGEAIARVTAGPVDVPPPGEEGGGEIEPPTAAPVPERALIEGLAPGVARWRLVLARRFGEQPPAGVREIEVVVGEPEGGADS